MKKGFLCALLSLFLVSSLFASEKKIISVDLDSIHGAEKAFGTKYNFLKVINGIGLIEVTDDLILELSHHMHEEHHRCGGFMMHDSLEEATKMLSDSTERISAKELNFADYSINQNALVKPAMEVVSSTNIAKTIRKLSSYHNRYYQSKTGVESSRWIASKWEKLTAHRSDADVELYKHPNWKQESIILTIKGKSDETIVIGGHADSIAGYFRRAEARAPGADDNASGIATITEIVRVLMDKNYEPKHTLKFMGYAAEEVGLLGSKEIAKTFKNNGEKVLGVMQLDMTNFKGSEYDIVLIDDYTNKAQNAFVGKLIDHYLPGMKWGYDSCGYACSDHASWHMQGFPASTPFEAKKSSMNKKIHTARDTISISGDNANHAAKFAKLGLAYLIELDR